MFFKVISDKVLWVLIAGAFGLLVWIYQREGISGLFEAFSKEIKASAIKFSAVCLVFILIVGSIDHLAKKNPEVVKDLISGKRGQLKMMLVSMVLPGPAGANQLREEWERGENYSNIIFCLTAMMAMGINIFIFRAAFLGPPLTLIWVGIGSLFLIEVWLFCKLFGN